MGDRQRRQHGVKGVYYGGDWVDIEDCDRILQDKTCSGDGVCQGCPRSSSANVMDFQNTVYDVCIIGAGCIGAAVARELSKYQLTILWVEASDDVSQGATKGT